MSNISSIVYDNSTFTDNSTSMEIVASTANPLPDAHAGPDLSVMNGVEANPGEFPHLAYLQYPRNGENYVCSGSIIHPLLILTAAHCTYNVQPPEFRVVTGEHDGFVNMGREQWITVRSVIAHEDYWFGSNTNNVALLVLQTPIKLDNFTQVINIPQPNQSLPGWAYVSAWSLLANRTLSESLRKARVDWIDMPTCQSAYEGKYINLTDHHICARSKDICTGGHGDPLTCEDAANGEKYLCGILTWWNTCDEEAEDKDYHSGVFTDLRKYHDWIQKHIQHWSEFYSRHYSHPQPRRSDNACQSGTSQSFTERMGTWWESLWG